MLVGWTRTKPLWVVEGKDAQSLLRVPAGDAPCVKEAIYIEGFI